MRLRHQYFPELCPYQYCMGFNLDVGLMLEGVLCLWHVSSTFMIDPLFTINLEN